MSAALRRRRRASLNKKRNNKIRSAWSGEVISFGMAVNLTSASPSLLHHHINLSGDLSTLLLHAIRLLHREFIDIMRDGRRMLAHDGVGGVSVA